MQFRSRPCYRDRYLDKRREVAKSRPFEKARTFVRKLKLKSRREWRVYCRSGKKPNDIPATPDEVYAAAGWIGMSDWLGSGRYFRGNWRPFKQARALVRGLGLKSQTGWLTYCRSGKKPNDIPSAPWGVYADDGWIDLVDRLGAGRRIGNWRPFNEARAFVRSLGLKNEHEWNATTLRNSTSAPSPVRFTTRP